MCSSHGPFLAFCMTISVLATWSVVQPCPESDFIPCKTMVTIHGLPFERNILKVIFTFKSQSMLSKGCRIYKNAIPCFRDRVLRCGEAGQKQMLSEVTDVIRFFCGPESDQNQQEFLRYGPCISTVMRLPPNRDCGYMDAGQSVKLTSCRDYCSKYDNNILCLMKIWMSEQSICTLRDILENCDSDSKAFYTRMRVTLFDPQFPIMCSYEEAPEIQFETFSSQSHLGLASNAGSNSQLARGTESVPGIEMPRNDNVPDTEAQRNSEMAVIENPISQNSRFQISETPTKLDKETRIYGDSTDSTSSDLNSPPTPIRVENPHTNPQIWLYEKQTGSTFDPEFHIPVAPPRVIDTVIVLPEDRRTGRSRLATRVEKSGENNSSWIGHVIRRKPITEAPQVDKHSQPKEVQNKKLDLEKKNKAPTNVPPKLEDTKSGQKSHESGLQQNHSELNPSSPGYILPPYIPIHPRPLWGSNGGNIIEADSIVEDNPGKQAARTRNILPPYIIIQPIRKSGMAGISAIRNQNQSKRSNPSLNDALSSESKREPTTSSPAWYLAKPSNSRSRRNRKPSSERPWYLGR